MITLIEMTTYFPEMIYQSRGLCSKFYGFWEGYESEIRFVIRQGDGGDEY